MTCWIGQFQLVKIPVWLQGLGYWRNINYFSTRILALHFSFYTVSPELLQRERNYIPIQKKKKKCFEMFKPVWLLFYVVSNSAYQYERKQNNNPWNWWAKFKLTRDNLKRILMLHWPYPLFCSRFLGESCLCEWFRGDQRPAQNNRGENFERQWLWSVWI